LKQMSGTPEDSSLTREEHLRRILDACAEMMLGNDELLYEADHL